MKAFERRSVHINGKYLVQKMTGVQRYATWIAHHLDGLLADGHAPGLDVTMFAPHGVRRPPKFRSIHLEQVGESAGPLWEQSRLAGLRAPLLLNLGNTAPVLRRPKIACIHDVNSKIIPKSYSPAFRAYYNAIMPLVVGTSEVVITVSDFSAAQLRHFYGIRPDRIRIIPNGHEHVFEWDSRRTTLDTTDLLERPFFLVVGSHAPHKNLAVVARIAERAQAHGINFLVAGGSGAEFAKADLPGKRFLNFLGFVSDDDLAWLYRHALGLLFPSRLEGFGIPMVEAMALGCPTIASTSTSMPAVGGDAVLYAAPDDSNHWFHLIMRLANEPSLREELIMRGRQRVELFSWRRSAGLYLDLLLQLA